MQYFMTPRVLLHNTVRKVLVIHTFYRVQSQTPTLDFEGFRHKKSGFIIKELSICSNNYTDTILFLPPVSYNSLSASERKSHQWVSRFLHGLSWNSGNYPYWFISQFFIAIKLRFPSGKF